MKPKFILILFSLILGNTLLKAQSSDSLYSLNDVDTLRFMDGKVWIGKVNQHLEEEETYLFTQFIIRKKGNFLKDRGVADMELFSILSAGKEKIVYQVPENDKYTSFAPQEMNFFVYGRQDARAHFKPWLSNLGAGLTAYAGGYIAKDNIFTFMVPMFSIGVFDLLPPLKSKNQYRTVAESYQNPYYLGYKKQSKAKRRLGNIICSVLGWGLGVITYRATQ